MLEDFLTTPTGENLVSLGNDRAQLIINSLDRGSPDRPCPIDDFAALYAKVASSYVDDCDAAVKEAVECTVGRMTSFCVCCKCYDLVLYRWIVEAVV